MKQILGNGLQGYIILKISGFNGNTNQKLFWADLSDDEDAVKADKVMDVEENQTSLMQKTSILKPIQIHQLVNKIKPAILQEICPILHNLVNKDKFLIRKKIVRKENQKREPESDFPVLYIFPVTWVKF